MILAPFVIWLQEPGRGPSSQYLRTLAPKTIPSMVLGTRVLKYWVLGASGEARRRTISNITTGKMYHKTEAL